MGGREFTSPISPSAHGHPAQASIASFTSSSAGDYADF
jgi:hypothetical protein